MEEGVPTKIEDTKRRAMKVKTGISSSKVQSLTNHPPKYLCLEWKEWKGEQGNLMGLDQIYYFSL